MGFPPNVATTLIFLVTLDTGILPNRCCAFQKLSITEPQEIKFPIGYFSSVGFFCHDCTDIIGLFLFYTRKTRRVLLLYEYGTNGIGKYLWILFTVLNGCVVCVNGRLSHCVRTVQFRAVKAESHHFGIHWDPLFGDLHHRVSCNFPSMETGTRH